MPLLQSALPHRESVWTYPLDDSVHGYLIRDVETEKYSIPFDVGQLLDSVQVWYAGGVLHLHTNRLTMVDTIVDVGLIQRTGEAIGLPHISSLQREERRRTCIWKVAIAGPAIQSQQVYQSSLLRNPQ
jgi:hypothetical protein